MATPKKTTSDAPATGPATDQPTTSQEGTTPATEAPAEGDAEPPATVTHRITDLRSLHELTPAVLPDQFDAEISKLLFRDTTSTPQLNKELKKLAEEILPFVEGKLGREVAVLDTITTVGLHTGEMEKGGAVFFVDTVEGGQLTAYPQFAETTGLPTEAEMKVPAQKFHAERGRLVLIEGPYRYQLDPTPARGRAVIIYR